MRALMPFDTEKERKPLKVWEISFSWRHGAYFAVSLLIFIQLIQYTYNDNFPFAVNVIVFITDALIFIPAIIFSFLRNASTGLFMDRHLLYSLQYKKKESGLWRRF